MKKILTTCLVLTVVIVIYQLGRDNDNKSHLSHLNNDWETFELDNSNKLSNHKSTKDEIMAAKLPQTKKSRSPASIKAVNKREPFLFPGQKMPKNITYKNKIKADWKEKMAPTLMRFLNPNTKLFVKEEKSIVILERDQARYAEKVLIKFQTKTGRHYSYNALVDSETGHIIKTWNRMQHEGIGHKKIKMKVY
jgi:hypothetical protein